VTPEEAGQPAQARRDPVLPLNRFLAETNDDPRPFTWTADPDKIIAAASRGNQKLESSH